MNYKFIQQISPVVSLIEMFSVLDCGEPPTVDNATIEVSNNQSGLYYLNGTTITYKCQSGMRILPKDLNTVTCMESGKWSTKPGKCYSGKRKTFNLLYLGS